MKLYNLCLFVMTITGLSDCSANLFNKDLAYDDLMCHPDNVEFQETSENVVSCARRCGETPGCQSLIYLGENTTCIGIKSSDPFSASTPLPGAMFYRLGGSNPQVATPGTTPGTTGVTPVGTTTTPSTTGSTIASATTTTTTIAATTIAATSTTSGTASSLLASVLDSQFDASSEYDPGYTASNARLSTTATSGLLLASVTDSQFDASSEYDPDYTASNAQLSTPATCWVPIHDSQNQNQWVQVDFVSIIVVTGVVTAGDSNAQDWVTSYKVLTSVSGSSFTAIQDGTGNDVVFAGNTDNLSEVTNTIAPSVTCRCFRINPWTWNNFYIALRFDVIGHAP